MELSQEIPESVMPTYARANIAFERGEGAYLYATDGNRYLDFATGIAVTSLGHNHPHLVEALTRQAQSFWHCSNLFRIPDQEKLAERLTASSFAERVFFCNSGAEAVEAGLKICRKYQAESGHPERYRVITFSNAFHGRTLATISAGGNDAHRAGFGPAADGFDHVPLGNMNAMRDAITPETAAVLIEPVQGEGGIHVVPTDFLKDVRTACDEFGLLLMYDEVQCGMGRTGHLFGYQISGVAPDVMSLAKGIGGGFPMGACLATEKAAVGMVPGTHGSTFGGNPLAMAVGNAVLDILLADGFFSQVRKMAEKLTAGLEDLAARFPGTVKDVRGAGLMIGFQAGPANSDMVTRLREEKLLTVPAGDNVVRLLPPLTIDESHVQEAMGILESVIGEFAS